VQCGLKEAMSSTSEENGVSFTCVMHAPSSPSTWKLQERRPYLKPALLYTYSSARPLVMYPKKKPEVEKRYIRKVDFRRIMF
jgi:hypothetical protein